MLFDILPRSRVLLSHIVVLLAKSLLAFRNFSLTSTGLVEMSATADLEPQDQKDLSRLSLWGLFKEIFNWYPSEYAVAERKSVPPHCPLLVRMLNNAIDCCSSWMFQFLYLRAFVVSSRSLPP